MKKGTLALDGLESKNIDVIENKNGTTTIRLTGNLFNSGSHELTASGKETLRKVATSLKKSSPSHISIEGHTDLTPMKKSKTTYGTNMALSAARAFEVQSFLQNEGKISENLMSVSSFGDNKPLAAGTSKEANEKNRRVELVLSR
jgi:chemotaxis protein MotB